MSAVNTPNHSGLYTMILRVEIFDKSLINETPGNTYQPLSRLQCNQATSFTAI